VVSQPATTDNLAQLREAWLTACLNFDEQTAERVLAQAFALFTVEVVCIELLQRGLAAVGNGWYAAKFTVQQEHFASALATRRLEALLAATPAPTR
ncbi:MAG TPA: B12-binding domain-containing protein, partial [Caldilineaceae bacterium]|nr:B12-binding domain-containing protein [Caldilineaceae bacterium]